MAGYTDKQKLAFTEIAYYDLDRGVNRYLLEHPDQTSAPLSELLNPENHYLDYLGENTVKEYRARLEVNGLKIDSDMSSWKISAVHDTNDENGFYACVIETSEKEATVAFRGSEGFDLGKNTKDDWWEADVKLLNNNHTKQDLEAEKYLQELRDRGVLDKYDGLSFAGHSLGGELADHGCITAVKLGYADKVTGCYNMDGPGHSMKYNLENKQYIDQVSDKMEHKIWSIVGAQEFTPSGVDVEYWNTTQNHVMIPTPGIVGTVSELLEATDHARYNGEGTELTPNFTFTSSGNVPTISGAQFYAEHPRFHGTGSRILDVTMFAGEKILSFGGNVIKYSSPLYWGGKAISFLWNKLTGGDKHKETPEEAAARIASAECAQYIGFYIDPAAVTNLATAVQTGAEARAREVKYALEDIQRISYTKSTGRVVHNDAGLKNLKSQIDEAEKTIKIIQDTAGSCKSQLSKIQATLSGMVSYLAQTGSAFQQIEDQAQGKASSWAG